MLHARIAVILAEAIFTVWLGGLADNRANEGNNGWLRCPWDKKQMDYSG
jgi:hypothetical protein